MKHNRYLIEEAEFMHKMTPLDHPDSRAKLCAAVLALHQPPVVPSVYHLLTVTVLFLQLVLVVNDGLVIVHKSEHSDKYALLAFVRWFKKSTNEHAILNENGTVAPHSAHYPLAHVISDRCR